jgi:hypothetical protein
MKPNTLAAARLRFLFLAAWTWLHARRVGVSYRDHYQEKSRNRSRINPRSAGTAGALSK